MESYWDLYVAYVHHCVEYNKKHDIDPHHYGMEWNHFLPQCLFGDSPFGQYLLLRQHAIASALQTLAFKRNCLCGFHKKHLPKELLELAWNFYRQSKREHLYKLLEVKDEDGKSLMSKKAHKVTYAEKREDGKCEHAVKAALASHNNRDESGRSVKGLRAAKRNNAQRWRCLTTGFVSNPGALSRYQKARGLSTERDNREQVFDHEEGKTR
jgi:hypothetical protein